MIALIAEHFFIVNRSNHTLSNVTNVKTFFLHLLTGEELHERVEVFCDNMDSSVTLPDIGTWVAVRVTAVFNPGHFWVQFPYGTEPIEKRIMAGMLLPWDCKWCKR